MKRNDDYGGPRYYSDWSISEDEPGKEQRKEARKDIKQDVKDDDRYIKQESGDMRKEIKEDADRPAE